MRDERAWSDFLELYQPLLWRVTKSLGLNDCDAADAVQEILLTIFRSIERYESRPHPKAFRGWLATIAKNTALNYLTRNLQSRASGGTSVFRQLHAQSDPKAELSLIWESQHRKQLIAWAAQQVSGQVSPPTFAAFWRTMIEGETVETVALALKMSIGNVYVARGRVMHRMKKAIDLRMKEESE